MPRQSAATKAYLVQGGRGSSLCCWSWCTCVSLSLRLRPTSVPRDRPISLLCSYLAMQSKTFAPFVVVFSDGFDLTSHGFKVVQISF